VIGENCRALGFNVDFAPVLDLAYEASRAVMTSRAVSDDPKRVVAYAREFLRGLRDAGVLGCGKHFPGLGAGKLDSHYALPVIEKPIKKMWIEDLFPYRILRHQLPFVMVSHAAYPEVTGERTPASLSRKWITEILRRKIGYNGLVVSDDMEMGAVLDFAPIEQTVVQHIRAGGDMALICHKEEMVVRAYEALIHEAERDRKFRNRAAEAVNRVQTFRKKLLAFCHYSRPAAPTQAKTEKLTRQLWEFEEEIRLATLARRDEERA
jgi:beta-N-acetylhexosaminidase